MRQTDTTASGTEAAGALAAPVAAIVEGVRQVSRAVTGQMPDDARYHISKTGEFDLSGRHDFVMGPFFEVLKTGDSPTQSSRSGLPSRVVARPGQAPADQCRTQASCKMYDIIDYVVQK